MSQMISLAEAQQTVLSIQNAVPCEKHLKAAMMMCSACGYVISTACHPTACQCDNDE